MVVAIHAELRSIRKEIADKYVKPLVEKCGLDSSAIENMIGARLGAAISDMLQRVNDSSIIEVCREFMNQNHVSQHIC